MVSLSGPFFAGSSVAEPPAPPPELTPAVGTAPTSWFTTGTDGREIAGTTGAGRVSGTEGGLAGGRSAGTGRAGARPPEGGTGTPAPGSAVPATRPGTAAPATGPGTAADHRRGGPT